MTFWDFVMQAQWWHWLGLILLIAALGDAVADVVKAARRKD